MKKSSILREDTIDKASLSRIILNKEADTLTSNRFSHVKLPTFELVARSWDQVEDLTLEQVLLPLTKQLHLFVSQPTLPNKRIRCKMARHHFIGDIAPSLSRNFVLLMSGAAYCKIVNPTDYDIIVSSIREYPPDYFACIYKDITRTQPLRNVLASYAIRNPRLHYCQGMNNLCISLLQSGYSEGQAFWMMVRLIEKILPFDFYLDMKVVISLVTSLKDLLDQHLPEFTKYAKHLELSAEVFLVEWWVTLFTKDINPQVTMFIRECLVVDGIAALMGSSLAFLSIIWKTVKDVLPTDQLQLLQIIRSTVKSAVNRSQFKKVYDSIYLNHRFLQLLVDSYLGATINKQIPAKKQGPIKLPLCNNALPVCLHAIQLAKRRPWTDEVSTFKVGPQLELLAEDNYFCSEHVGRKGPIVFKEGLGEILIGRSSHVCSGKRKSLLLDPLDMANNIRQLEEIEGFKPDNGVDQQGLQSSAMPRSGIYEIEMLLDDCELSQNYEMQSSYLIEDAVQGIKNSNFNTVNEQIRMPSRFKSVILDSQK